MTYSSVLCKERGRGWGVVRCQQRKVMPYKHSEQRPKSITYEAHRRHSCVTQLAGEPMSAGRVVAAGGGGKIQGPWVGEGWGMLPPDRHSASDHDAERSGWTASDMGGPSPFVLLITCFLCLLKGKPRW